MTVTMFEVGGCVRDRLLGVRFNDIDFTCVVTDHTTIKGAWQALRDELTSTNFEIFLETPQYYTIRARFPRDQPHGGVTADFVLARREGPYTDGRHPDWVEPGSLVDDLARRDFTMNALARNSAGDIIDPHGGQFDLAHNVLRCVGSAEDRLREDALRALRAIRFQVTKGMFPDMELKQALVSDWLPPLLSSVSAERKREELHKAFKHDTLRTLEILCHEVTPEFSSAVFTDGLWLTPTLERRRT